MYIMKMVKEFYSYVNLHDFGNLKTKKTQSFIKSYLNTLFPGEGMFLQYTLYSYVHRCA